MCTNQICSVDHEHRSSSFSTSSSGSISKLEQQVTSAGSMASTVSNASSSLTASSSLHSNFSFSSSSKLLLNLDNETMMGHMEARINSSSNSSHQNRNEFQNKFQIPNCNISNSNSKPTTSSHTCTINAYEYDREHISSDNTKSGNDTQTPKPNYSYNNKIASGDVCYGEVFCFINTFISNFTKEYYMKAVRLTTFMLPILVLKVNILFDHFICLCTLFALRYAAVKWIGKKETITDDYQLVSTTSSSSITAASSLSSTTSPLSSNREGHIGEYAPTSTASDGMTCCSSSLSTMQHSLDHQSSPSCPNTAEKNFRDEAMVPTQRHIDDSENEVLSPATFIPIQDENTHDEWGHFTDFEVDIEESSSGVGLGTGMSMSMSSSRTLNDPFCSITKSMLRRRGHKLSVCKLEQLQEEEEFCEGE